MGFFDGVCSVFSAIGGAIGELGSAIGGLVGRLGGFLGEFGPLIELGIQVVSMVAKIFGLASLEEDVAETGLKASKCGKNLEDFDDFDSYKEYLNQYQLSPEDKELLNDPANRQKYSLVGTSVYLTGMEAKDNISLSMESILDLCKIGIVTGDALKVIIDTFKELNTEPKIDEYVSGKLNSKESAEVGTALNKGIDRLDDPEKYREGLEKLIDEGEGI